MIILLNLRPKKVLYNSWSSY